MKVWVRQVYIEAGVSFPFSHLWQRWLTEQFSSMVRSAAGFESAYGSDFKLGINISARKGISENAIKGPGINKMNKNVEYTLFLPYDVIMSETDSLGAAMAHISNGVQEIFVLAGIEAADFGDRKELIMNHVRSDESMLKGPWPKYNAI